VNISSNVSGFSQPVEGKLEKMFDKFMEKKTKKKR